MDLTADRADPAVTDEQILLGDEAVARGAIDAGTSAAYAYPGTPSTEIFQTIQDQARALGLPVRGLWSTNEKVALEEGVGVSYAGKRAIVSMKHVGLNVAADPFMNAAVSGAHGGLVVVVADDPGDAQLAERTGLALASPISRWCPAWSRPTSSSATTSRAKPSSCPSDCSVPVMLRLVTRLAHSRARGARAARAARPTRRTGRPTPTSSR